MMPSEGLESDIMSGWAQMLPEIGMYIIAGLVFVLFASIVGFIIFKFRHKFMANCLGELYLLNKEGNILERRTIYGKIDKEKSPNKAKFFDIKESLDIGNTYPILEKSLIGVKRRYQVYKFPDGHYEVTNPTIRPWHSEKQGKDFILDIDPDLDMYKKWFLQENAHDYEQSHREEVKKTSFKVVAMILGAIAIAGAIVTVAIYFSTKTSVYSIDRSFGELSSMKDMVSTLFRNITYVR